MIHVGKSATLVAILSLSTTAGLADSQSTKDGPPSSFKTDVTQIDVAVVVRNKEGAFVRGLQSEDIDLYEDNVRQQVAHLIQVDLPTGLRAGTNGTPPSPTSVTMSNDRRVYLVVLDDLQIASEYSEVARRSVRQFIQRHLAPTDVVGVVFTSGVKNGLADFTLDRQRVLDVISSFSGRKELVAARREDPRAEYAAWKAAQTNEFQSSAPGDGFGGAGGAAMGRSGGGGGQQGFAQSQSRDANSYRAMADFQSRLLDPGQTAQDASLARQALLSMDMLRRLTEGLGRLSLPRKSILYFSQGVDYDVDDVTERSSGNASNVRLAIQDTISLATRNNVAFYAFDPRGVVITDVGYGAKQDNADGRALKSLQQLATETGGFAAARSNDFGDAYDRLVQENSQYYVVGYYPSKPKDDGRFHKIEVRIRGRADVSVVARRGYVAPDGKRVRKEQREREKLERKARQGAKKSDVALANPAPVQGAPESSRAALAAPSPEGEVSHVGAASKLPAASTAPSPAAAVPAASAIETESAMLTASMTAQLAELLESSVRRPGMALRMKEVSFDKAGPKVEVCVSVVVDRGVPFRQENDRFKNLVVTGLSALDTKGRTVGTAQAILNLNASADEAENIRKSNTGWALRFLADPGRYHVRLAAAESVGGQKGSLFFDVDVPNFADEMAINAMVVKSQPTTRGLSSEAGPMDARGVPMQVGATSAYTQRDTLRASAAIYANKPRPTKVTTKLLTEGGTVVMEFTEACAVSDFQEHVCYAHKTLPLASLDPGAYVLRYEATPTQSAAALPIVREVAFTVLGTEQDAQTVVMRP